MTTKANRDGPVDEKDYAQHRAHHQVAAVLPHKPAGTPLAEEFDPDDRRDEIRTSDPENAKHQIRRKKRQIADVE